MASRLHVATGVLRWVVTGDRLFEGEETEEKFFWDFVREPLSSDASSFTVAFRMLLKEASTGKIVNQYQTDKTHQSDDVRVFQDILKRRPLVGALRRERLL